MSILRSCCTALCAVFAPLLPAQDGSGQPVRAATGEQAAEASAKAPPRAGLVVGVVDLEKAMELYPKALKERERLQKLKESYDEQLQQVTKRLEELKALLPALREGTMERARKQLELEQAMQARQGLAKLLEADLQLEDMRVLLAIYEDIEIAVAQLAKDRGVHVVLRLDTQQEKPDDGDKLAPRQVQRRLEVFDRRKVWFAAEELDLTPALIKMLQVPLELPKSAAPKGDEPPAPQGGGKDGK